MQLALGFSMPMPNLVIPAQLHGSQLQKYFLQLKLIETVEMAIANVTKEETMI